MLPLAFAAQRAIPPRRTFTKHALQETSWPRLIRAKESVRSLKSKSSFASLTRRGNTSQASLSPRSPQSPAGTIPLLEEAPPPVPSIPLRFLMGSPEPDDQASTFEGEIEVSFRAYEPSRKTPTTPTSSRMRNVKLGSTTTVNTIATTPSRELLSVPEDPEWDEAVARVRKNMRREQEEEERERKASWKVERRYLRSVSKAREGHFKRAKLAIDGLVGKYDEHGWLPKKEPKDFDDDDWRFVLEVLDHEDTKTLRDRLFKKPEWIEADKVRKLKYEEAMRTNPTPEYLAAQKSQRDKERKEYGFRKLCGLLTEEEKERERLAESGDSPPIGLGISNAPVPLTPGTTRTSESSRATAQSSPSSDTFHTPSRGRLPLRPTHTTPTPTRFAGSDTRHVSLARHSVEQMTGVFNIEGFDPRLSRLGSEEIKQYIRKKSSFAAESPTPQPTHPQAHGTLDPRQMTETLSRQGPPSVAKTRSQRRAQAIRKVASVDDLSENRITRRAQMMGAASPSPRLPTVGIHPALRVSSASATPQPAASQISRLRKVRSSITPSTYQLQPPKPLKPSSAVKSPSEPTSSPPAILTPPPPKLNKGKQPVVIKASLTTSPATTFVPRSSNLDKGKRPAVPKTAPIIRKPSTAVRINKSASNPAKNSDAVRQQTSPASISNRFEASEVGLAPPRIRPHLPRKDTDEILPLASFSDRIAKSKADSAQPKALIHSLRTGVDSNHPLGVDNGNSENGEQLRIISREAANDRLASVEEKILVKPQHNEKILSEQQHSDPGLTSNLTFNEPLPKSLARMSRIPSFPDADHFLAAMRDDEEDVPHDTTWSLLTSLTPRDRLTALRSGFPVATGSNAREAHQCIPGESSLASPSLSCHTFQVGNGHSSPRNNTMPSTVSPTVDARSRIDYVEDLTQLTPTRCPLVPTSAPYTTPLAPLFSTGQIPQNQQMENRMPRVRAPEASSERGLRSFTVRTTLNPNIGASPSARSFSMGHHQGTEASGVDADFEDVINAWQQSSPIPSTQSHNSLGSFNNQEIQILRSEIGLEPIHEHIPGNAKHPNHHYTWNTKKIMCRRIHNPGIVLPSLPSPTPGRPANMGEYASEFFVGSPYTNEPTEPARCDLCSAFCCHFAELSDGPQKRTTDVVELSRLRRNADAVARLRTQKPNGVEEWDAFLKCSTCDEKFCPDCIMLCAEALCQEPVCEGCRGGLELCHIHNVL
jgi:hypothetical protein